MYVQTRAEYLDLLAPLVAVKNEPRFYLQGVAIQSHPVKGVYVVATDGHRIGVFHDESGVFGADEGERDTLIVPVPKELRQAARPRKQETNRFEERVFTWTNGQGTVTLEDVGDQSGSHVCWNATLDPIDGTFPDWMRVFPPHVTAEPDAEVQSVNPGYLDDFCRIARSSDTAYPEIRVHHGANGEPMVILTGREDFVGLLMPMRHSLGLDNVPAWLQPAEREEAAEAAAE